MSNKISVLDEERIQKFVERIEGFKNAVRETHNIHLYSSYSRKYVKLENGSRIYCFVEIKNGDVLMAASRLAPAKKARSNIYDSDFGLSGVNEYGANYLK